LNKDPATEMEEMDKGAFPADVSVTVFVAFCPTATDPKATFVLLIVSVGAATFSWMLKLFAAPFAVAVMPAF
jgi:hypothetical protein